MINSGKPGLHGEFEASLGYTRSYHKQDGTEEHWENFRGWDSSGKRRRGCKYHEQQMAGFMTYVHVGI